MPKPLSPSPPHGMWSARQVAPRGGLTLTIPARSPRANAQRAVDVARHHAHREPEAGVVGERERLPRAVRPTGSRRPGRTARRARPGIERRIEQHRGRHARAVVLAAAARARRPRAASRSQAITRAAAAASITGRQRRRGIAGIAGAQRADPRGQPASTSSSRTARVDDDALRGDAVLPGVRVAAERDRGRRAVDVGVVEHDQRGVRAELAGEPLGAGGARDRVAGFDAPGEGDLPHAPIAAQRRADRAAVAGEALQRRAAAGPPDEPLHEEQRGERRAPARA